MLTPDEIKKLFLLARIEASEDELKKLPGELDAILTYASVLQSVQLGDALPTLSLAPRDPFLRADETKPVTKETVDLLLGQFPENENGYLKTKKVFEGE